jgi:hypothetical protein
MSSKTLIRIKNLFDFFEVTDEIYNRFIETGEVQSRVIEKIATKIILQSPMTENEKCIFFSKTSEVNEMIRNINHA